MVLRRFTSHAPPCVWAQRRPTSSSVPFFAPVIQAPHSSSTAVRFSRCVICVLQPLPPLVARVLGQRAPAMLAYVVSEGRLFALNPSDWAMLLVGVALCGFGTLLF
jgi:hypothetical protein